MKSELLSKRKFLFYSRKGEPVVVAMDLYKIRDPESAKYPEGYRMSWIAFDPEKPREKRVLFDSHPPKGPHFHIDNKKAEISFVWLSLKETETLFFEIVCEHFNIDPEEI